MMYQVTLWSHTGQLVEQGDEQLISRWQEGGDLFIWLDASDNSASEESELLEKTFGLHPLAIRDAQRHRHPPKIETFETHWFLLLKELASVEDEINFSTTQLAIFTGHNFLITRRSGSSPSTWRLTKRIHHFINSGLQNPVYLSIYLAKNVADEYVKLLLRIETKLEELEEEMFEHPQDAILAVLVRYQTHLRKMIRILSYHKQIFIHGGSNELPERDGDLEHEWNDVFEHCERGHSLAALYYQNASDLIEGYISVASHRLNQIMKVLTVITVIFVPLSFIAGIYGMNFENMPELKSRSGYFILLGTMGFIATTLLFLFKRKRWL